MALIANELIQDYRALGKEGEVFKIDFEKVDDNVKWLFLDFLLERKGFGEKWRSWILGCLSSVSYSMIINGRLRGKFKGSRGLREGDPLSPFLFTLVADGLGRLMALAKQRGLFGGLTVGRENLEASHLQFVDETLFFAKPTEGNLNKLVRLDVFCHVSGFKINM